MLTYFKCTVYHVRVHGGLTISTSRWLVQLHGKTFAVSNNNLFAVVLVKIGKPIGHTCTCVCGMPRKLFGISLKEDEG